MKDLLTFLLLWIGISGFCNPNPHIAPAPKIRYIVLELPPLEHAEQNFMFADDYYNANHTPIKSQSRISTPTANALPSFKTIEYPQSHVPNLYVPFSTEVNDFSPPSNFSTKGVNFGGGDMEFGSTGWGDGEEEEPGFDPYPINGDIQVLSVFAILYTLVLFRKKNKNLYLNNNENSV